LADPFWLSCPGCPVLDVLSFLYIDIVHGSTFLKNKRIAPTGFMVNFLPADKQKKGLIGCTHTHISGY
jgi:hypothetical protein